MSAHEITTAVTVNAILDKAETDQARRVLEEIFADIHPPLSYGDTKIDEIFNPESAGEFLARVTDLESLLSEDDPFERTLEKFQTRIDAAEKVRDEVMARLFKEIRPIEASYRQIWLFFENSVVPDGKQRLPVDLRVFDADTGTMKNTESVTLGAIRKFLKSRNDLFNFRKNICNLVLPGPIPMMVREALEEEAYKWGMLLVTDLADERSYEAVERQFRTGGRYEFLKRPDDKAASDVVMVGFLKLRDCHWFEQDVAEEDGLYTPASVIFAGSLARTDRALDSVVQGPVGTKFGQIKGVEKARIECLISQMELLSQQMQVIPIIRDADNRLCFYGCRSLADDPYGVLKFFTAYRVLMYLERVISNRLREVAAMVLTREFMDEEIEKPIRRLLEEQKEQGTIIHYELFVDKSSEKRMQGVCDIELVVMPTGPAEVFQIKVDVPEFEPDKKK